MLKIVSLQIAVTAIVALVLAGLWGFGAVGLHAGLSAGLGGLACVLPNALFALRLMVQARRSGGANVASFFAGEFVKLALTVVLLFVIAMKYHDLNWLALLIGFIAALKSYLLSFLIHKN